MEEFSSFKKRSPFIEEGMAAPQKNDVEPLKEDRSKKLHDIRPPPTRIQRIEPLMRKNKPLVVEQKKKKKTSTILYILIFIAVIQIYLVYLINRLR